MSTKKIEVCNRKSFVLWRDKVDTTREPDEEEEVAEGMCCMMKMMIQEP